MTGNKDRQIGSSRVREAGDTYVCSTLRRWDVPVDANQTTWY
jgi:hypothetical protein